jgi:hypothetical protein
MTGAAHRRPNRNALTSGRYKAEAKALRKRNRLQLRAGVKLRPLFPLGPVSQPRRDPRKKFSKIEKQFPPGMPISGWLRPLSPLARLPAPPRSAKNFSKIEKQFLPKMPLKPGGAVFLCYFKDKTKYAVD